MPSSAERDSETVRFDDQDSPHHPRETNDRRLRRSRASRVEFGLPGFAHWPPAPADHCRRRSPASRGECTGESASWTSRRCRTAASRIRRRRAGAYGAPRSFAVERTRRARSLRRTLQPPCDRRSSVSSNAVAWRAPSLRAAIQAPRRCRSWLPPAPADGHAVLHRGPERRVGRALRHHHCGLAAFPRECPPGGGEPAGVA